MGKQAVWRLCRRIGAGGVVVAIAAVVITSAREGATVAPIVSLPSGESPRAPELPKPDVVPRLAITARVSANGLPSADVAVSISDGSRLVTATAWTDREGTVRFADLPAGPYEIWATADAQASPVVRLEDPKAAVELALGPAANVRGQLTAEGFVPPGSTIMLVPLDGDHAARAATVDDTGRFALEGVPLGRWRIEVNVPGHALASDAFVRVGERETSLAVRLVPAGSVSGTVVDSKGTPVPFATIVLRDPSGVTTRPPAIVSTGMRWVHPLASTRFMPVIEPARFGQPRIGTRGAECGRGHCGIDIGSIRGSVVHAAADGEIASIFAEPRTEAGKVVAIQHGGGLKSFYMHLDEIRPGLEVGQSIRAGEPVGLLGSTGFTRSLPHVHFAITHEYRGRTWYLDPEPTLRHAVVLPAPRAYGPFEASASKEPLAAQPVVQRIVTDAKGGFHAANIAPGTYIAGAFASEYAPNESTLFVVKSSEDTPNVLVTLNAGMAVAGVVIGRDGPLANAIVMAGAGMGETAHKITQTMTDNAGRFTLRALAGRVTVTVLAPSYGELERMVVVDEKIRDLTFQLAIENARLRGQVLAPDGGAAAGVAVRIVDGPTKKRTITDGQGRFALNVANGNYVVELSSPDFPTKQIDLKAEIWKEIRLDTGGGARVIVRDAQSASPLANAKVELAGPNDKTTSRTTDAKGVLEIRGLVPGEWKVTAKLAGYTAVSKTLTLRAERTLQDAPFDLARSAIVTGTVRDRTGHRVSGARVTIGAASTKTDADGNFRIADAPVGTSTIEAELEGARGSLPIELTPGAERSSLTVELQ